MKEVKQPIEPMIGDTAWLVGLTGWSHDRISRLARRGLIKGAFKTAPGQRGEHWYFRKGRVLDWLDGLETAQTK